MGSQAIPVDYDPFEGSQEAMWPMGAPARQPQGLGTPEISTSSPTLPTTFFIERPELQVAQPSSWESLGRGALQGATLNWSDELAGLNAASGVSGSDRNMGLASILLGAARMLGASTRSDVDTDMLRAVVAGAGADVPEEYLPPPHQHFDFSSSEDQATLARYAQAAERERLANTAAQVAHPGAYFAGEVGGAVPSMLVAPEIAPFKVVQGATFAGRALPAAGNLAATGATYGAIAGAGAADGDPAHRAIGALRGATLGALFAPALGAGFFITGKLGDGLTDQTGDLARRLGDPLREAFGRVGDEANVSSLGQRPVRSADLATPSSADARDGGSLASSGQPLTNALDPAAAAHDLPPLRNMSKWTDSQRTLALAKAQILNDADTLKSRGGRSLISAVKRFLRGGGIIKPGHDVDHKVDLQLGGSDTFDNMWSLDRSVNRSLGAQIQQRIKHLPIGARIGKITIEDP